MFRGAGSQCIDAGDELNGHVEEYCDAQMPVHPGSVTAKGSAPKNRMTKVYRFVIKCFD